MWALAAVLVMVAGAIARQNGEDAQDGFLRGLVTGILVAILLFKAAQ